MNYQVELEKSSHVAFLGAQPIGNDTEFTESDGWRGLEGQYLASSRWDRAGGGRGWWHSLSQMRENSGLSAWAGKRRIPAPAGGVSRVRNRMRAELHRGLLPGTSLRPQTGQTPRAESQPHHARSETKASPPPPPDNTCSTAQVRRHGDYKKKSPVCAAPAGSSAPWWQVAVPLCSHVSVWRTGMDPSGADPILMNSASLSFFFV